MVRLKTFLGHDNTQIYGIEFKSDMTPNQHIITYYNYSGYTREKIRNLNDHCNDDCNSSLELSDLTHERKFVTWMIIVIMIAMRL